MENRIFNCISTIDYFEADVFNDLGMGVEIQDFTEPSLLDYGWEERVDEYTTMLEGFSNPISLHGPFLDLKPASPDNAIREVTMNRYLTTLNIGSKLNVDYIVFHSQINPWINEPRIRRLNNSMQKEFWEEVFSDTDCFQGTILIENIFEDDPILLKELMDTINLPNMKVCLDVGHARLSKDIDDWVKVLKDNIEYMHIHWNGGLYDDHLKPSDENIMYIAEVLKKYDISSHLALEYDVNDVEDEVKRIRKILSFVDKEVI